jgi:hypothetical protein
VTPSAARPVPPSAGAGARAGRLVAWALAGTLLSGASCAAAHLGLERRSAEQALTRLVSEQVERELAARPDLSTLHGDHRGDDRLEPVTQASLARDRVRLKDLARRLDDVPRAALPPERAAERDSLAARISAALRDLEVTRRWERDPSAYLDLVGRAVETLVERGAGSSCARAHAMARRLQRVPDVLRAARVNLAAPPRDLIEASLPGYERLIGFYRGDLPGFGAQCHDPRTQADLAEADTTAVRAVTGFLDYLRADLLPRASGISPVPAAPDTAR